MENFGTLQSILLAGMVVLIIIWFRPGIKAQLQNSRDAPKDWAGLLIPLGLVVLFVIFLISMVR